MVHPRKQRSLKLNGSEWAWASSMRDLIECCEYRSILDNNNCDDDDDDDDDDHHDNHDSSDSVDTRSRPLTELKIEDFDLDTPVAARIIRLFQRHSQSLERLCIAECSGHVDLVLAIALTTLPRLQTLSIIIGQISPNELNPYASALGVCFQSNSPIRELSLKAGSNIFFTLSSVAARALVNGFCKISILQRFHLIGCRFEEASALPSLARGLRRLCFLEEVRIQSCFQGNGHVLGDPAIAELLFALGERNRNLQILDLRGNQCVSAAITAVAKLLYRTSLKRLNLSSQCVRTPSTIRREVGEEIFPDQEQSIRMDLSLLVAALCRTKTLKELDLRYNCLDDSDVAYLAAALKQNTSIHYLGLSNNWISNVGVSILATEIPAFQGLRRLDMMNNEYDDHGLMELAIAMKDNESIESIQVDYMEGKDPSFDDDQEWTRTPWKVIRYYADLNGSGRRQLNQICGSRRIVDSLWPLILSRAATKLQDTPERTEREADIFFTLLRQHANIFPS